MLILYKYTDFDGAVKIIENNSVLLKNPTEYNDPFDCKIEKDLINYDSCVNLIINYYTFKHLSNFLLEIYDKLKGVSKFTVGFILFIIKIYKFYYKKYHFYEKIPFFNNLFDLACKRNPKFKFKLEVEKENFVKEMKQKMDKIIELTHICCFSKKDDSILMWSHYADSHKGVCFEFESLDDKSFQKVRYSKKRENFNLENAFRIIFAYDYLGEKVDLTDDEIIRSIMKYALTKAKDWEYEKEIRCIYSSNNKQLVKHEKGYLLNMKKIKRIYLGCKMSEENKKYIKENVKGIEIIEKKASVNEFRLIDDNL